MKRINIALVLVALVIGVWGGTQYNSVIREHFAWRAAFVQERNAWRENLIKTLNEELAKARQPMPPPQFERPVLPEETPEE